MSLWVKQSTQRLYFEAMENRLLRLNPRNTADLRLVMARARFLREMSDTPTSELSMRLRGLKVQKPDYSCEVDQLDRTMMEASTTRSVSGPDPKRVRFSFVDELTCVPEYFEDLVKGAESVQLDIDSIGGDFRSAQAILTALDGIHTTARITRAWSAGSVLAIAADRRVMAHDGTIMIHGSSALACGGAAEFREHAKTLDYVNGWMIDFYHTRAGVPVDIAEEWVKGGNDIWFDSTQALRWGLVDEISDF